MKMRFEHGFEIWLSPTSQFETQLIRDWNKAELKKK